MTEPTTVLALAGFSFTGFSVAVLAGLKGWHSWLDLKREELTAAPNREPRSPAMERIEIADLKERIRKLESIAACVDL